MHTDSITHWTHEHAFLGAAHSKNERRTWLVVWLTAATMIAEIVGGSVYGSMALMADGWHMSTHAGALAIAALAYRYAREHLGDSRFSFGTGKCGELAGYSSALILAVVALLIGYQSVLRLFDPVTIRFDEAIGIAVIGLLVNLASAWLLRDEHRQTHEHEHDREHEHAHAHHHDHNLRAAYLHVLADALTSVLAIVALVAGSRYGCIWMDPVMGIVGTAVIARWSLSLLRSSGAVLLDTVTDPRLAAQIKAALEVGTDRVADLHLWRVGPGHAALIATVVAEQPDSPAHYKARLNGLHGLSHVTIEVHPCPSSQRAS